MPDNGGLIMTPALCVGDPHVCPLSDGPKPHVGGPLTGPGAPTFLIGGKPAAVVGDLCACAGPPDAVVSGHATILIATRAAADMRAPTAHGGKVLATCLTVLFG
jgi:uncharacterized Zn-binding protein involved in type VI secretion